MKYCRQNLKQSLKQNLKYKLKQKFGQNLRQNIMFIIIISALLFSVQGYEVNHFFQSDGLSRIKLTVDYSDVYDSLKQLNTSFTEQQFSDQLNRSCNGRCTVKGTKVSYEKELMNNIFYNYTEHYEWFVIKKTTVTIRSLPSVQPVLKQSYKLNLNNKFFRPLKIGNITFKYTVHFDQPVAEAHGADIIKNKRAEFNLLKLLERNNEIIVSSYSYDFFRIVLALSVIILLYYALGFMIKILFTERPPKPRLEQEYVV